MKVVQQELIHELNILMNLTQKHEQRCPHRKHTPMCNNADDLTLQNKKFLALKNQKLNMSYRKLELERERLEEMKAQGRPKGLIDEMQSLINEGEKLLNEAGSNNELISQ